jgi:hypothetical protein
MTEFDCGVGDARMDIAEGWLDPTYKLDDLVAHLRIVAGYSDEFIAGYLSVVFNPTGRVGIALL